MPMLPFLFIFLAFGAVCIAAWFQSKHLEALALLVGFLEKSNNHLSVEVIKLKEESYNLNRRVSISFDELKIIVATYLNQKKEESPPDLPEKKSSERWTPEKRKEWGEKMKESRVNRRKRNRKRYPKNASPGHLNAFMPEFVPENPSGQEL